MFSFQSRIWNVSYVPDEDHLQPDYPEALPTSILFEYISAGRDVFKTPGPHYRLAGPTSGGKSLNEDWAMNKCIAFSRQQTATQKISMIFFQITALSNQWWVENIQA